MSSTKAYAGPQITVTFDSSRCIHAGECVRGLPAVFDARAQPWIQPGNAGAEAIAEVVTRCPSGALRVTWKDGRAAEPAPTCNEARVCADGPLYLRGAVELRDAAGNLLARETRVALCRCGASRRKPYCDGSHAKAGFADAGQVADNVAFGAEQAEGPLVVTVLADGPLQVKGKLVIKGAQEAIGFGGEQCWLCRCGASGKKPFCDGSHKKAGFSG
jgi:CDGSH-type Zn-finger protein/uncharacterized Fe-S cluster protein YjdI